MASRCTRLAYSDVLFYWRLRVLQSPSSADGTELVSDVVRLSAGVLPRDHLALACASTCTSWRRARRLTVPHYATPPFSRSASRGSSRWPGLRTLPPATRCRCRLPTMLLGWSGAVTGSTPSPTELMGFDVSSFVTAFVNSTAARCDHTPTSVADISQNLVVYATASRCSAPPWAATPSPTSSCARSSSFPALLLLSPNASMYLLFPPLSFSYCPMLETSPRLPLFLFGSLPQRPPRRLLWATRLHG